MYYLLLYEIALLSSHLPSYTSREKGLKVVYFVKTLQ